ncbi:alpha/beta hydrolase [Lignipirellula cremea]|uniref:Acetylxylan esterase n=1 Tax=Lignipirellula cremea TaxID=2528010 RepID=A0A518DLT5_9BACT|nr:alpha/beta hydrolase [Lignipirellula cremea]QDU92808.1 Acetylxylan esterase precursor [Lignipirellula cremea]
MFEPASHHHLLRQSPRFRMTLTLGLITLTLLFLAALPALAGEAEVVTLWPGEPPGPAALVDGKEVDRQQPDDRLVGGHTVMKLANIAAPTMHVYLPPADKANGAACLVCPGGGFSILAWDLEGVEAAEWLNSLGVAAIILKYRVPTRAHGAPGNWQGPVNDAQRALSLIRSRAQEWRIDPQRIGVLGFSAGGQTAALTAVKAGKRLYPAVDAADEFPCGVDFALLVYTGGVVDADGNLQDAYAVDKATPPMFFVHAADDRVTCLASVALFTALKKAGVPAELHIYRSGGHGYGLRPTDEAVTHWPLRAAAWLKESGFLKH